MFRLGWLFRTDWRIFLPKTIRAPDFPAACRFAMKLKNSPGEVSFELPEQAFVCRTIDIPRLRGTHIDQAVDAAMRSALPGGGEQFVWRAIHQQPVDKVLRVRVAVLGKAYLSKAQRLLLRKGIKLDQVTVASPSDARIWTRNSTPHRGILGWSGALAAILFVFFFFEFRPLLNQHAELRMEIAAEEERVSLLFAETEQAAITASSAAEVRDSFLSGLDALAAHRGRTGVLAEVTHLLGDDTWLEEMRVFDHTLRISVTTSSDPLNLMQGLEASSLLERVKTEGAILTDRVSGARSVDLVMDIAERGAK